MFSEDSICAKMNGNGYYSCAKPLHGRYLVYTLNPNNVEDSDVYDVGIFFGTIKVFGSTNLAISSSVIAEPARDSAMSSSVWYESYSTSISSLNPRASTAASNIAEQNCRIY